MGNLLNLQHLSLARESISRAPMWRCTMITKMHSCEPITKTSIYMTNGIHKIHRNDWHGIWPHGAHSIGYNFSTSLKQQELPSPTTFRSEPTCYIEKFSSGENNTQNAIIQLNSKNFQPIGMVIYVQQTKRNFQIEEILNLNGYIIAKPNIRR